MTKIIRISQKHCIYVARRLQLQGEYYSLAFITLKGWQLCEETTPLRLVPFANRNLGGLLKYEVIHAYSIVSRLHPPFEPNG